MCLPQPCSWKNLALEMTILDQLHSPIQQSGIYNRLVGVRLNICPFLTARDVAKKGAGLLRAKPTIKWDKDRGKEPERPKADYPWFWCESEPTTDPEGGKTPVGKRWNNVHLSLAFKKGGKA